MGKRTLRHPQTLNVCVRGQHFRKTSISIVQTLSEAVRGNGDAHTAAGAVRSASGTIWMGKRTLRLPQTVNVSVRCRHVLENVY
jgi:hypothetical protein